MDSRAYVFIFAVNAPAEVPDDFRKFIQRRPFETGVFLPQRDANWFTRHPEYPARLLLLNDRCLYVVPHPSCGLHTQELKLDELVQLETGNSLLRGWMEFSTGSSTDRMIYNTRASGPLEKFIQTVTRRWLGGSATVKMTSPKLFGQELDIKFRNLLHGALDRNEVVLSQCFTPPVECQDKGFLIRRVKWRPAHLVVATSGNRLLWLNDEMRGRSERYAGTAISAPISLFRSSRVENTTHPEELIIEFANGRSWRIAMYEAESGWSAFARTLTKLCANGPSMPCALD